MTVRVAMWSGPRNLSTALMRAWENRTDTMVLDEPLYAHYLDRTGLEHPGRAEILAAGPVDECEAIARCLDELSPRAEVSYQKHMAQHLLADMDRSWLDQLRNFLLIRHPVEVLASYSRVREEITLDDIGLPQQVELAARTELIIDAGDFLVDPQAYLRAICTRVGLRFEERMLSWPPGPRESDGCWAPYWYAAVEASTAFGPHRPPDDLDAAFARLPARLQEVAVAALPLYERLAGDRLVVGTG